MADLTVELYGIDIGVLSGPTRTFDFVPTRQAVDTFGIDSLILSVSIPLAVVPTRARKERRRTFFAELLPEGRMLRRMAQEANLAEYDTIGLLRRYGRDTAGALQIWDPEVPGEPRQPRSEALSPTQVAELLRNVQDNPLGNRPVHGKTSLAGVQDKIVLVRGPGGWSRALDGYPSTHILKPVSPEYPTAIYDEEYGARLARQLGLSAYDSWIEEFDGTPALVIERYDRSPDAPQGRIHQEDFSQALGAGGDQKYQQYGGRVSLGRVAAALGTVGSRGDLERLLRVLALAVAVGNLDLHTKNLSLLHPPDGSIRLAPVYDMLPQVHQRNDGELALAVDGIYRHADVTAEHLTAEGRSWGLPDAETIARDALAQIIEAVSREQPHPQAYAGLVDDLTRFSRNLLDGRPAGRH